MPSALAIAESADALGLTRGETAQLLASVLSAIGGLAAAYAAWKAARLSAIAITEMREARHQAIRPSFLIEGGRRLRAVLTPAAISLTDEAEREKLPLAQSYDCFRATNIGLGIAQKLEAYVSWDGPPLRDVQKRKVEEFLARNRIGLSGYGSLEEGIIHPRATLGHVGIRLPASCRPDEDVQIRISEWDLEALMLKVLAYALRPLKSGASVYSEGGDLNLTFVSLSGEEGRARARVVATGYMIIRNGEIEGPWSEASLYLSFSTFSWSGLYPQPRSNLVRLLWLARGRRVPTFFGRPKTWKATHHAWVRRLKRKRLRMRAGRLWADRKSSLLRMLRNRGLGPDS